MTLTNSLSSDTTTECNTRRELGEHVITRDYKSQCILEVYLDVSEDSVTLFCRFQVWIIDVMVRPPCMSATKTIVRMKY